MGVGDPEGGDIFLPPVEWWGQPPSGECWMKEALERSVKALQCKAEPLRGARVREDGKNWMC